MARGEPIYHDQETSMADEQTTDEAGQSAVHDGSASGGLSGLVPVIIAIFVIVVIAGVFWYVGGGASRNRGTRQNCRAGRLYHSRC